MEDEALGDYCRRMISLVRHKQQLHLQSSEEEEERRRHRHKGAGGRERSGCERRAVAGDEFRDEVHLPVPDCTPPPQREQTSPYLICQGPEVHTVPPQLISMLKLKTFKEEMRRVR